MIFAFGSPISSLGRRVLSLVGLVLVAVLPAAAQSPGNVVTGGFTRPGWPNDKVADGKIVFVADDKEAAKPALGGTVYSEVLQLAPSRAGDDPWSTGVEGFTRQFIPGLDFNGTASPSLDTRAKYLYLYQVVNDRRTDAPIESTAIKLNVELSDITSWGYFDGVGFGLAPQKAPENAAAIRPVSFGTELSVADIARMFKTPSPLANLPQALKLVRIPTRRGEDAPRDQSKIVNVVWDALDPANNADHVMLLNNSDFDDAPSVRAIWSGKNVLERNGRSTVFGFTSNLPPEVDLVRIRTTKEASKSAGSSIRFAGTEVEEKQIVRDGIVGASGQVPTPKPDVQRAPQQPFMPTVPNTPVQGGFAPPPARTGGGGRGGGSGGGGVAGGFGAAGMPFIGGGGGNGNGNSSGNQQQNNNPSTEVNFKTTLTNQQQQQQKQGQGQHQHQSGGGHGGGGCHGHVVPEPATLLGASLGLPLLAWLYRRKK